MNKPDFHRNFLSAEIDAKEARLALRLTAHLTEQASDLPADLSERLRFAREQALEKARTARQTQQVAASGVASWGPSMALFGSDPKPRWWMQLGAVLPLVALVAGLVLIQRLHDGHQISAAAEIDALLLSDDLPPMAYADPGFVEFLKAPRE